MREVKFRAWDKKEKKMITWKTLCNQMRNVLASIVNEFSHWELLQRTGLKDKNGKEIYDGDIVKVFVKELDKYLIGKVLYKRSGRYIDDMYLWEYSNDCEIMGNIYQNPELLNTSTS